MAVGDIMWTHFKHEHMNKMVNVLILLPIKPVRFQLVMITR